MQKMLSGAFWYQKWRNRPKNLWIIEHYMLHSLSKITDFVHFDLISIILSISWVKWRPGSISWAKGSAKCPPITYWNYDFLDSWNMQLLFLNRTEQNRTEFILKYFIQDEHRRIKSKYLQEHYMIIYVHFHQCNIIHNININMKRWTCCA